MGAELFIIFGAIPNTVIVECIKQHMSAAVVCHPITRSSHASWVFCGGYTQEGHVGMFYVVVDEN